MVEAESNKNVIETHDLTVYYGALRGIEDVNLTVERGEIFGFLGPNGAGKTTTQRVLLDIIRPVKGSASIFGMDCRKDGVAIRKRIGYIPGELNLPKGLTGRQYLNMLDVIRPQKADQTYRRKLNARFDLDVTRKIRTYSRGNKQKLALVAAFMHKPDLLMLDEPTGGLDPLMQQAVIDTIREAKNEGRTVFFSSHILPEVQSICDRVGVIRQGQLVTVERVQDLLKQRSHRLRLRFGEPLPDDAFEMDSIRVITQTPHSVQVEIYDGLARFMQKAAQYHITDLQTDELSLEEAFMSFYGPSANQSTTAQNI